MQLMTTPTLGSVKAQVTSSACNASSFSGNTMSNAMWRSPQAAPPSPHCGMPRPVMTLMQRALTTSSICNGESDHAVIWREKWVRYGAIVTWTCSGWPSRYLR